MTVGSKYAPQWREYTDQLTGRSVRRLADSSAEADRSRPMAGR
jgi:hypothetical protein